MQCLYQQIIHGPPFRTSKLIYQQKQMKILISDDKKNCTHTNYCRSSRLFGLYDSMCVIRLLSFRLQTAFHWNCCCHIVTHSYGSDVSFQLRRSLNVITLVCWLSRSIITSKRKTKHFFSSSSLVIRKVFDSRWLSKRFRFHFKLNRIIVC